MNSTGETSVAVAPGAGGWRAGDLLVDLSRQRVERDGALIELPKLSFDLLVVLLEAAPAFVSLDDLMTRVWKGLVVSPETVTQRVKLLRDALGDDPRQPRYIEGLRGRGYRFVAPVNEPLLSTAPPRTSQRYQWWLLAAGLAALASLAFLLRTTGEDSKEGNSPRIETAAQAPSRTVAVLPFQTLGGEPGEEYIGPGIAGTVLDQLAKVRGLTVIARESSFRPEFATAEAQVIGERLHAGYLVNGDVQRAGNRLRASARLVDSLTATQLWSRQFERDADDILALQDDIASGVRDALQAKIAGIDPARPVVARSANPDAWLAYLHGRTLVGRFTVAEADAAAAEFERAIELDPGFAPALVALYDARMQAASLRREPLAPLRAKYQPLLDRAVKLDPEAGAVWFARAMWADESPVQKEADFRKGATLDPSNGRGLTAYSEFLDNARRREEGEAMLRQALLVDPLAPRAHFRLAQRQFAVVGSKVEEQARKVLEIDPQFYPALQRYGKYQWQQHGDAAGGLQVLDRAIRADPQNPWARHTAAALYLDLDLPHEAEAVAAATPASAASTKAMLASYRGDWRAAGEAAQEPGATVFGGAERWCHVESLRDYALKTGEVSRISTLIARQYDLPLDGKWELEVFNFREAQVLAHLLIAQGRRDEALGRLDEVIAWIDANEFYGPVYNLRTKARALMLKGDTDAALAQLAESFNQDDYTHGWYTVRRDPTWEPVRHDPRFIAIAAQVQRHVSEQAALHVSSKR